MPCLRLIGKNLLLSLAIEGKFPCANCSRRTGTMISPPRWLGAREGLGSRRTVVGVWKGLSSCERVIRAKKFTFHP